VPRAALALTLAAVFWTTALVAAPALLTHPVWAAPAAVIYAGSARVCHQRPERSFRLAGTQFPVCARCFGLYLAGAAGAVAAWSARRGPGRRARMVLAVAAVPTAVTWTAEFAGLAGFSNTARAVAALPLGAVGGWVFVQLLRYDSSLDGHQVDDRRSPVHGG
jgi:uncharacterized membrane protein